MSRVWVDDGRDWGGCLVAEATAAAGRNNKNKFKAPVDLREIASVAEKCRNPVLRNVLRHKAREARREFDARVGALPKGKTVQRPTVKRLWINGKAGEDRDEWMEDAKAIVKSATMTDESSQEQEEMIEEHRIRRRTGGKRWKERRWRSLLTDWLGHEGRC